MADRLTDLSDFGIQNYMIRLGASTIINMNDLMVLSEEEIEAQVHTELVFNLTHELARSILNKEIPVELWTSDDSMIGKKVSIELAVVPKPMEMFTALKEELPYYSEETLAKVHDILHKWFGEEDGVTDGAINDLQNAGILFRERA